jgi:hypothetical protein
MNRAAKAGALAFGLAGLLLVVALGSRGGPPTTDGRVSPRSAPVTLQDSLISMLAIAYIIVLAGIVILLFRYRHRWQEPESRWLRNFVTVLLLMAVVTGIGYWAMRHGDLRRAAEEQAQRQQQQEQQQRRDGQPRIRPVPARSVEFQWPLAVAVGGLVLLGVVLVVVRRRRSPTEIAEDESVHEGLARAVQTTIDDLRREPEPRRAVIAAYAHMEAALASRGLARRGAETPFEYLARILRELNVRDSAVRSLTRLFEYAKFSPHEIGEDMREEAISALVAVRDDLLGAERAAA